MSRVADEQKSPKEMGPVAFVIGADPEKRIVIFQFGSSISRLEFGPEEAMEIASNLIGRAAVAAGKSIEEMVSARSLQIAERKKIAAVEETSRVGDISKTVRTEFEK